MGPSCKRNIGREGARALRYGRHGRDPGWASGPEPAAMLEVWRRLGKDQGAAATRLLDRPRLLKRLRKPGTPVVLLNAPSGYGKSVLLAQWADQESRPVEAIMLAGPHNDPVLLVGSIVEALEQIEPLPSEIRETLAGPAPDLEKRVLPRLRDALHDRNESFLLIVDDLGQIESPDSLRAISTIGRSLPGGSQLALATRSDPGIPIGRLRAHRGLTELGRAELAMNKAECQELISGLGLEPTAHQLDVLVRRTEGWPAALYLAGLALADASDLDNAIAEFAGDDRIVVDYIREEFLAGLSRRRLEFLRRVSILDRLSGELCDEVLGRTGSATVLRDLSHSNMLLTPLDRRDEWFRFHALLRDMLRSELHRIEPELEPELHRRALDWWADRGEPAQAINHAIEGEALTRAGKLLWEAYPEHSSRGRQANIKRWLDRIGPDGVNSDPYLSLVSAYDAVGRGASGEVDHWAAISRELAAGMEHSAARDELLAALRLLKAALAREGVKAMVEDARASAELFSGASPWISMCSLLEGVGLHLQGQRDRARLRLSEGARRAAVVSPTIQVLCLAQLVLLAIEDEDWQAAEVLASQARAQLKRSGIDGYSVMTLGVATSSLACTLTGQPERAASDLRRGLKLLDQLQDFAPWYVVEARVVLARTAVRLDDAPLAARLLEEATRLLRQTPDAVVLGEWIEDTQAAVETVSGSRVTDLTPAELRVLQYMPTHLSFSEIAEAIFVSANTVKTQAQGVYRKLGVSSRRGAVDEARRVGLIDSGSPVDTPGR
jgi:LuxR family transcriptional regulator, maltose regulon positive regulatory protein